MVLLIDRDRDNVKWSQAVFDNTVTKCVKSCELLATAKAIPCCGITGENLVELSPRSEWYASQQQETQQSAFQSGTLLALIDELSSS